MVGANDNGIFIHMRYLLPAVSAVALLLATPATAADDNFEFWINPSVEFDLDEDTATEFETPQRFRGSDNGPDTYFARLWLHQSLNESATLSGAVEYRVNDGEGDEVRLNQQLTMRSGILRARVRLEQRFVDDEDRMGVRLRTRLGVTVPFDADRRWSVHADAETFWTLRSTSIGGQGGLTGLRTQIGVDYTVNDRLSLGLTYLRQQDIRRGSTDTVGHAPVIGIELAI